MKAKVIKIGNSKGVRLPKSTLELCNLTDEVDIEVGQNGELILRPAKKVRQNWEESFSNLAQKEPLDFVKNDFDEEEWEW